MSRFFFSYLIGSLNVICRNAHYAALGCTLCTQRSDDTDIAIILFEITCIPTFKVVANKAANWILQGLSHYANTILGSGCGQNPTLGSM